MPSTVTLSASEKPVKDVFCDAYAFVIPNYQRPYLWETQQAEQLLEDLDYFASQDDPKPYFLGSIVVIKEQQTGNHIVVDGQQRLTTLTILLSVLRHLSEAKGIDDLIYEQANPVLGTQDRYRLTRYRDKEFFSQYIQKADGLEKMPSNIALTDSQSNIRGNALHFKKLLEFGDWSEDRYRQLAAYVAQHCYLAVVETSDEESAYRIFSVLNDRGIPLSAADILKAEIIAAISGDEQRDCFTKKWEMTEELLGHDALETLFGHIRMIHRKTKVRENLLQEIRTHVRPKENPEYFIDQLLMPYAQALDWIRKTSVELDAKDEQIRQIDSLLKQLRRLDNQDWVPPAMMYLSKWAGEENPDPDRVIQFLTQLERLAFGMHVLRAGINHGIEKYAKILTAIEDESEISDSEAALSLSEGQLVQIVAELSSNNVYDTRWIWYVIRRINEFLSDDDTVFDYSKASIEHVLPQNPRTDSEWEKLFTEQDRDELTGCLGNLVLLSGRKNSAASNKDFAHKKEVYFAKKKVSSFSIATQVLAHSEWKPDAVRRRRDALVAECRKIWRL